MVWCCFPRLDGDPIFCKLLQPRGPEDGCFAIRLVDHIASEQYYLRNTAILITELTDRSGGRIRVTDFIPRFKQHGRSFRPTAIMRKVEPLSGNPRIIVDVSPRFDYGREIPQVTLGSNHLRFLNPSMTVRLTTDASVHYIRERRSFVLTAPVHFILGSDETIAGSVPDIVRDFFEQTHSYWIEWTRYLSVPFEWQEAVIRAAITLKLCSFEETGAVIAAMTTSIPEAPESGRNWDYRYCWLRDAYFTVHALNRLGATRTMQEFIGYIDNVVALEPSAILKPVYGLIPSANLDENIAPDFDGYRGMGPVRIGNQASRQIQNDSYGSVILAAAQMFFDHRLPRMGTPDLFWRLERLGQVASEVALRPDAGLWEYRGRQRVHSYSAAMCWAACDRLSKIAAVLQLADRRDFWRREATRIRDVLLQRAWNEKRRTFVESFDGEDLDASLLLLHEIGLIAADDPRFSATVDVIGRELKLGNMLFRYRAKDDFGVPENAFTVCASWYTDALAALGRKTEARQIFRDLLNRRTKLGLLSEDVDPQSGELWGNFPQSYSMVGLVVSAMRLSKTWEEAFWRGW